MRAHNGYVKRSLILLAAMTNLCAGPVPDLAQLQKMSSRFARTELRVDTSGLAPGDLTALKKLLQAARLIDHIFLTQMWSGNRELLEKLRQDATPLGKERLHYFWLNKSPWSALDGNTAFLPGVPEKKLPGANFYPPAMTKASFESWLKTVPKTGQDEATGFFSILRKDGNSFQSVPYSRAYADDLEQAAKLLREAADATSNDSLKKFLRARASAFLNDDYYASDVAWMDLDAPVEPTIGPYETYNDEIFGYKAGFEAYITLRDDKETAKMRFFGDHMQDVENHLPFDAKYRNPKLGALSPIRVVNEVLATGDGAHGVRTAAYNLPNDDRVVREKGSKRVMLKNVQEAKFRAILVPLANRVLSQEAQQDVNFDSFFTHILAHEMTHGIGPHAITIAGRSTTVRQELKDLYSAIEEAKADVSGLYMLQYLYDHKLMTPAEKPLYTTYLASSFRTLRFGLHEAHGLGMAVQFNYLMDKGAFVANSDGTFSVDLNKIKPAVRDLVHDLLLIEATGDYAGAKKMLATLGVVRPPLQRALDRLADIPTDIEPLHVTAEALLK